jgi:predicted dinucleotide-binding enzyme
MPMIIPTVQRRRLLQAAATAVACTLLPVLPLAASSKKMRLGIVGSGRVGGALGAVWVKAGHEVMFSSLDIEHDRALAAKLGANARAGTPREAASFGEVLMISVPYGALPQVGRDLGELLRGKIVIDTCNPFVSRDGEVARRALEKGAGVTSAQLLPGARIVRAFNAIAASRMGAAHEEPGRVGMPIASDDAEAVKVVSPLIRDIGYVPVLVGGLAKGRYLMPGTALSGEHSPEEIRRIAATLK